MKIFRRYSAAVKAADGLPVIEISGGKDRLFIVVEGDLTAVKLTEVGLLTNKGAQAGRITMGHLDRLGNGNYATPDTVKSQWQPRAFKEVRDAS
jgi:hypothetical protein